MGNLPLARIATAAAVVLTLAGGLLSCSRSDTSIQGDVRLAQGTARTDNLAIKGPAADINVRGSADLRNQRFDQTVDVLPKSGGLLTAVGAIAGGPVGAAVGAMANAVLEKPLQGLGAKTYRVTGPWAAPKVEVTARNPAAQAKPARTQPQG